MITLKLSKSDSGFLDKKSLRDVLKRFENELSKIKINNDELSNEELQDISNEFDTIVDLFEIPYRSSDLNKELGTVYYETDIDDNEFTLLKTIYIYRSKFHIIIDNTYDIPIKYYIRSITYNELGYNYNNLVINGIPDNPIDNSILRIKFNDQSVEPNFESIYCKFIELLNIKIINNKKYVLISEDNKVDYDIFYSSLNQLNYILSVINLFEKLDTNLSSFKRYFSIYHNLINNDIHISKCHIDIDIHKKPNKRLDHYYVDSIIINNISYSDVYLATDSAQLFKEKLNIINGSMDRYIK